MTRTQRRIVAYIRLQRGRRVNTYEIRDAVLPGRVIENVRVQIHRAIQNGETRINSRNGPRGGYQWVGIQIEE